MLIASADDVAQIIEAVADLLWPLLALLVVWTFRSELVALSKRVTRLRAGGVEADLGRALDELQASAEEAAEATPATPTETKVEAEPVTAEAKVTAPSVEVEDETRRILELASESPRAALILLSAEIARKSREVLSTHGPDATKAPLHRQLESLEVSPAVRRAAVEFRDVRNRIVHGGVASDAEALRAIDAGNSILRAISRIPHELNIVIEPKVECFADSEGAKLHNFEAVLLGAEHPPDGEFQKRAFPHTDCPLPKGEPVTWEWKIGGRTFPETWYRDPETSVLVYGWTESLEFAGKPLHPGPSPPD